MKGEREREREREERNLLLRLPHQAPHTLGISLEESVERGYILQEFWICCMQDNRKREMESEQGNSNKRMMKKTISAEYLQNKNPLNKCKGLFSHV